MGEKRPLGTCCKEGATARITTRLQDQRKGKERNQMTKNLARHEMRTRKKLQRSRGSSEYGSRKRTMTRIQRPNIFKPTNQALYVHEGRGIKEVRSTISEKVEQVSARRKKQKPTGKSLRRGINIVAEKIRLAHIP